MNKSYFNPDPVEINYARWFTAGTIAAFFAILTLLYGVFFLRNFSGPLADIHAGDTDQWDYMGYYVAHNLSFTPFPHLNWINNQTFYPYGTNHVYQGWAFEQNYWYAICYHFWGNGPWLNIYYLISLFITSFGTYLLLRNDYGGLRATLAGLFVTFINFYALNKYPHHYAYAMIHWTVLSMVTDFLLARRVVLREAVSLRFLLLKGLLITLCLGHDIGYIAGYALSSFTLTGIFVAGIVGWRLYSSPASAGVAIGNELKQWLAEYRKRPALPIALVLAGLVAVFFYLPLLLEVAKQANSFTFKDRFAGGHGWVHPLRLLMPYWPGFTLFSDPLGLLLHDMPESNGAGSAGWFLVIMGVLGFWKTRRPIRWAYAPFLVFGVLHALYHPIVFPTLQVFPWDHFSRIPSRVTIAYPVILTFFALHWSGPIRPIWLAGLLAIGVVEVGAVYSFRYEQKPYYFSDSFKPYMARIREQPGEAILDWPFCIVGGNGAGLAEGICPLYTRTNTLYALQRFHGKKTVGQYFGRMHDSQLKPFIQAGWNALLDHPDQNDMWLANQLTTCLTDEQWRFFEQFYTYNDFAGINLCVDLLPQACVQEFYKRFGQPVAATEIPGAGHIVFIPKPASLRQKVNRQLGKAVRFPCGCSLNS